MQWKPTHLFSLITLISVILNGSTAVAQKKGQERTVFSKTTFDLGVVVSDLDQAAEFYKEVVGMTEVQGFSAPANVATSFGLTNNQPVVVRKFVMADVKDAPLSGTIESSRVESGVSETDISHIWSLHSILVGMRTRYF